jgi:uncharacterized protein (TIGR00369 family)
MTESAMLSVAQLQQVVDGNPYGCWLQLHVHAVTEEGIELRVPGRQEFLGTLALQRLHGGVLSSLVDVATGYAVIARGGYGVSTISLHVDYHRAATLGELCIEGRVVHMGGRICTAEAFIRDANGTLLASGRSSIYRSRDIHPALSTL